MQYPSRSGGVLLLAVLAAACDSAGTPADAAPADAADISDLFTSASAFDRIGCVPGSLAGFDPVAPGALWHHDFQNDQLGGFPAVIRYEASDSAPGGLAAYLNLGVAAGIDASEVTLTADDLFVRAFYVNPDGLQRVRAFDACALDARGKVLSGKWAICNAEWGGGCYVGTVSGVRTMRQPGEAEASAGIVLLAEHAGDPAAPWPDTEISVNVRVHAGIAYLARFSDGLRIVDVSDPAAPRDLGHATVALPDQGESYNDVKIIEAGTPARTYALVGSNRRGVVVIDVTDPAAPRDVATFPAKPDDAPHQNVHTLFTETVATPTGPQIRAYAADITRASLEIWNVSDPEHPARLGGWVDPDLENDGQGFVHDLYVENGQAWLAYWSQGLDVVDTLTNPAAPQLIGSFDAYDRRTAHSVWVTTVNPTAPQRVAVLGDEDWGAHMRVLDADPGSPTFLNLLGELSLRPEVSIHNIMAFGDVAYVAWYQDGLRLVDLSDPAQPTVTDHFNTWSGPGDGFYEGAIGVDVDLVNHRVYVADTHRGLLVFSVP